MFESEPSRSKPAPASSSRPLADRSQEILLQLLVRCPYSRMRDVDDQVTRWKDLPLVLSIDLTKSPLDEVSLYRFSKLASNCDSESAAR